MTGQDYTATGKPPIAWDDQAARDELVTALVGDALALLAALDVEAITKAGGKPAEAVALLALVAGQDVEPAEDSDGTDGRWRIARATAPDRVISTVDPDTRHAHKTRERRQDGFKAHVVVEPDTGLSTAVQADQGQRAGELRRHRRRRTGRPPTPPSPRATASVEVLGDSAYATGDMLHALDGKQWTPLVKPWPLRPAVEGGFTIDDFTLDTAAGNPDLSGRHHPQHHARSGTVTFGAACRGCPLARAVHHRGTWTQGQARRARPAATRAPQPSRRAKASRPPTASTGRWSNAPSPG